ncbi:hypothetical protein [Brevibacillus laterosporus]|nr:hypothetical protein [Brevibacillus laterosporus]
MNDTRFFYQIVPENASCPQSPMHKFICSTLIPVQNIRNYKVCIYRGLMLGDYICQVVPLNQECPFIFEYDVIAEIPLQHVQSDFIMLDTEKSDSDLFRTALDIAFTDSKFLSVIKRKMANKYIFKRYSFTKDNTNKNLGEIHFDVDCEYGAQCLIDPNFDVVVDFLSRNVVEIRGGDT